MSSVGVFVKSFNHWWPASIVDHTSTGQRLNVIYYPLEERRPATKYIDEMKPAITPVLLDAVNSCVDWLKEEDLTPAWKKVRKEYAFSLIAFIEAERPDRMEDANRLRDLLKKLPK
jgi:hypothetical protein